MTTKNSCCPAALSKSKPLALLLCLCLCFSALLLVPVKASAEGEVGTVSVSLSGVPVAMDGVYSISAGINTEGCSLVSYGWYDASGPADGVFGTGSYRV